MEGYTCAEDKISVIFVSYYLQSARRHVWSVTSNNNAVLKIIQTEFIAKIRGISTTDFSCMLEKVRWGEMFLLNSTLH